MRLSTVLLERVQIKGNPSYLVREIERHFRSWQSQFKAGFLDISWVGEKLVLSTDSPSLIWKWWTVERQYVGHVLAEEITLEEELASLSDDADDGDLLTAA